MCKDIWRDVPDFEGYYQISSCGKVKSLDREVYQKNSFGSISKRIYKGRNIKLRKSKNVYLSFIARTQDKTKTLKPHRLVGLVFIDNPENKPEINHLDGNKCNNKVDNLEWCTSKENKQHAIKTGLMKSRFGKKSNAVKSKVEVYKGGFKITELYGSRQLEIFGLTNTGVYNTLVGNQKTHRGYTFKRIKI